MVRALRNAYPQTQPSLLGDGQAQIGAPFVCRVLSLPRLIVRCCVGCAETAVDQDGADGAAGSGAVPMLVSGNASKIVGKSESCMIMMLVSAPPSDSRHTHGDDSGDGATGAVFRAAPPVSMTLRFDESVRHKL